MVINAHPPRLRRFLVGPLSSMTWSYIVRDGACRAELRGVVLTVTDTTAMVRIGSGPLRHPNGKYGRQIAEARRRLDVAAVVAR